MHIRFRGPSFAVTVVRTTAVAVMLALATHPTRLRAAAPETPTAPETVVACKACHGPQGVSLNPTFPNLAGQKAEYLEAQLKAFKAKERKNDFMNPIAGQLSDADIHRFSLYWSSLAASPAPDGSAVTPPHPAVPSRMTMPKNFPQGFRVYHTESEDGAITRRYANAVAWQAAKAGLPLPNGSILFQVSYATAKDASDQEVAGAVQSYSAMELRAGWGAAIPTLLRNGDWDYALFAADGTRRDQLNQAPCLACHKPQEANSYVFTLDKLRKAAG
ncbi:MAG TPA: cytochrome P460 family protein [Steroidobacteraceae bacterium]